jgi:hypothetical protein
MDENFTFFKQQVNKSEEYFENWFLINKGIPNISHLQASQTVYTKLKDAFRINNLAEKDYRIEFGHNCIGCNFEEGARNILLFFRLNKETLSVRYFLTMYTLVFYLQAERLAVIYEELGYTQKGKTEFDWNRFPNLQNIKYWANFFKHPKSYMLLHHPIFYLEGDPDIPNILVNDIINEVFIRNYYNGPKKNEELRNRIANQDLVNIIFPNLLTFTTKACNEFEKIIEVITKDENHIKKLANFTTKNSQF